MKAYLNLYLLVVWFFFIQTAQAEAPAIKTPITESRIGGVLEPPNTPPANPKDFMKKLTWHNADILYRKAKESTPELKHSAASVDDLNKQILAYTRVEIKKEKSFRTWSGFDIQKSMAYAGLEINKGPRVENNFTIETVKYSVSLKQVVPNITNTYTRAFNENINTFGIAYSIPW